MRSGTQKNSLVLHLLVIPTLASAGAPDVVQQKDSLGGITVGQRVSTQGWRHDKNGNPFVGTSIAGHNGALFVDICGGAVKRMQFQIVLTNDPHDYPGIPVDHVSDPLKTASNYAQELVAGLQTAGWTVESASAPIMTDSQNVLSVSFSKGWKERELCSPLPTTAGLAAKRTQLQCVMIKAQGRSLSTNPSDPFNAQSCSDADAIAQAEQERFNAAGEACPYQDIIVVDTYRRLEMSCQKPSLLAWEDSIVTCSVVLFAGDTSPCTDGL